MEVAIDSHALLWYLSKNNKLSTRARDTLDKSSKIIVSVIVILELLYILKKFGKERQFSDLLKSLGSEKYLIYPVDLALVRECAKFSKNLEMHDKLICATAKLFKAPLVTKDEEIGSVYKSVVW